MDRIYLQGQEQEWEPESGPECPEHHHHVLSADDALGLPQRAEPGGRTKCRAR